MGFISNEKFWQAIVDLAWPVLSVYIFIKLWPTLKSLIDSRKFSVKVGQFELNVADATETIGKDVAEIQQKIADIETRIGTVNNSDAHQTLAKIEKKIPSILWVDDYPSNNAFLIDKFQKDGIDVELSRSTEQAINVLKLKNFNAVITDLGRRENGVEKRYAGLELLYYLTENKISIPVIVFAGDRGLQNRDKLLRAGASEVTSSGSDVIRFVERSIGESDTR